MKKTFAWCLAIIGLYVFGLNIWNSDDISLRVVDENGQPIVGADAIISFVRSQQRHSKGHHGKTNKEGYYRASGKTFLGVFTKVKCEGYYTWELRDVLRKGDHDVTVVLRKVKKPIPLIVRKMKLEFPAENMWLGFDFEKGDWVTPHGKGTSKDVLMKFSREFKGYSYSGKKWEKIKSINRDATEKEMKRSYGKWLSQLQIRFSSKMEGIIEERNNYLIDNKMKMPHEAPQEGYLYSKVISQKHHNFTEFEEGIGHFIRTRAKIANGKVIRANYVKLNEDIEVDSPRNRVVFTYYFNPVVNDRNLEFLTDQNLATEQDRQYDP